MNTKLHSTPITVVFQFRAMPFELTNAPSGISVLDECYPRTFSLQIRVGFLGWYPYLQSIPLGACRSMWIIGNMYSHSWGLICGIWRWVSVHSAGPPSHTKDASFPIKGLPRSSQNSSNAQVVESHIHYWIEGLPWPHEVLSQIHNTLWHISSSSHQFSLQAAIPVVSNSWSGFPATQDNNDQCSSFGHSRFWAAIH